MKSQTYYLKTVEESSLTETLTFLLTNYLPRALCTRIVGRLSKIESRVFSSCSIKLWQLFSDDMRLHEAQKTQFRSIHACFTRTLRPETRPIDNSKDVLSSPCDAVIGAHGDIRDFEVAQIKGMPYSLSELTQNTIDLNPYEGGRFITLRLKSSMYHHMHAPTPSCVKKLHYIAGDVWNVNPPTLKRIERLFCKNERAVLELELSENVGHIAMIPVAAVLVASMRFKGLDYPINLKYQGPNAITWNERFQKGERIGNFEHGSTIVMLTSKDFSFVPGVREGNVIRMGQALMRQYPQHIHSKQCD